MYYKNNNSSSSYRGDSNRSYSRGSRSSSRYPKNRGSNIDASRFVHKAQMQTESVNVLQHNSFADFAFTTPLQENISRKGYTVPTPIQDQSIEPIMEGRDLIGLANTGTGKTAAFLLPIIDKIFRDRDQKALIVVPTRELAQQITQELHDFAQGMKIYAATVIGGASINRQIFDIKRNPHFVIGTPGRLKDLIQQRILRLDEYSIIVLDEVDLMVDIGFINDVKFFISLLPKVRQSLFFSATISPKIRVILDHFVKDPVTVSIRQQSTSENIDQDVIKVMDPSKKVDQLHDLLIRDGFEKVLIFNRTKYDVDRLNKELLFRGFKTAVIHGNKSQGQRKRALDSFKDSEVQILIATDVASRGLDIDNVTHVINYDLPDNFEDYIHRIGRTGRANKKGSAITFV